MKATGLTIQPSETMPKLRAVFAKQMPREQAKHAAKRYLSAL